MGPLFFFFPFFFRLYGDRINPSKSHDFSSLRLEEDFEGIEKIEGIGMVNPKDANELTEM